MKTQPNNKSQTNKMTSTTKPASSAAIIAQRDAGHKGITARANSVQADASDRKTRWQDYLNNPLSLDRPAAMALFHELQALTPMAVAFNDGMLEWQIREFDKRFFAEEKPVCVSVLNTELDAALVPKDTYFDKLIKWGQDVLAKIHSPATTPEEKEKLLVERDRREDAAETLVNNICFAKAAIARFSNTPTAQHFGEVQGAIGCVKSALA